MKSSASFIVSVTIGVLIIGIMIYLLPVVGGASAIWFAMPLTEIIVAAYAAVKMI